VKVTQIRELERMNRLYAALSHINRAIIHRSERLDLLRNICQALVNQGGFGMAWIGWNDHASHRLVPEASWGHDADYAQSIEVFTDDRPEGRGPAGTAFREERPYICNDVMKDPAMLPWREAYRRHGFRAAASFPVHEGGLVKGVLAVYAYETNVFASREIELIVEAAANISFALDNLRRDAEVGHAAQAVRHEQMFTDSLLESLPGIFYFFDEQGRFLRWNRNFALQSGYSVEEIRSLHPTSLFAGYDQIRVAGRIDEVFRTGSAALEADFVAKDGRATPYYLTGRRVIVAGIIGLIGMGIEITDRRRAEAQVRDSAALNRGVLDSMLAHIAVLDADGIILAVNDAWRQFSKEISAGNAAVCASLDVGADYLANCRAYADVPGGEPTEIQRGLRAVLNGEIGSFQMEYECRTSERTLWFLLTATRLRILKGGAVIAHIDITKRKAAEQQLQASNQRFDMLARATNDAVRDWDLVTQSVWWNEGIERLFGCRREELESDIVSWIGRIHSDDRNRIESGLQAAIRSSDQLWTARYRFKRGDGSYADVQDRSQIIRDCDGRAIRVLGGMNDITEQLLLEGQLRQSLRLEAVGQLTGGVAHDFNNLLTVILGNAELLVEQLEPTGLAQELAQMIGAAANNAAELTNRLLAFARRQALNPVGVDCNGLIADVLPLLRRTLGEHIQIKAVPATQLWEALVDPAQLENAVLNLCINSRDAMPGGGQLLIQTENCRLDEEYTSHQVDVTPGDYVLVSVTDTGCGVPEEIRARVFEPFFTTKEKGRGTGLGLAMVYGFIKQTGGHISIYSEPGEGTAVKMYLPRLLEPLEHEAAPPDPVDIVGGVETILLVEDDKEVRRLANSHLTTLGYRVLQADNGIEALGVLDRHADIDLLFTDLVMPGSLNGRKLADAALERRPGLKVLFTSGYSADAIVHHGRLDPGINLLPKPYRRRDLALRVRSVLDGR
jgi:PAS domain S-box-containing protein